MYGMLPTQGYKRGWTSETEHYHYWYTINVISSWILLTVLWSAYHHNKWNYPAVSIKHRNIFNIHLLFSPYMRITSKKRRTGERHTVERHTYVSKLFCIMNLNIKKQRTCFPNDHLKNILKSATSNDSWIW